MATGSPTSHSNRIQKNNGAKRLSTPWASSKSAPIAQGYTGADLGMTHDEIDTSDRWVNLLHPPSAYAHDQALLLCSQDDRTWLAWVPNYGEITLRDDQFF